MINSDSDRWLLVKKMGSLISTRNHLFSIKYGGFLFLHQTRPNKESNGGEGGDYSITIVGIINHLRES